MTEPPTVGPSDPDSAIHENWSDSDWEQWFGDEVEATDRWKEYAENSDAGSAKKTAATNSETGVFEESVSETISHINKVRDVDDSSTAEVFFPSRPPAARVFSHMTPDKRRAFFEGWYRVNPFDPTLLGGEVSETLDAGWATAERRRTVTLESGIVMVMQADGTFVAEGADKDTMPGTEGGVVVPSEAGSEGWEDVPKPVDSDGDGYVDGTDQTVEDAWDSAVQDAAGSNRYGNRTIEPGAWQKYRVPVIVSAAVFIGGIGMYLTLGGPNDADPEPAVSEILASAVADAECDAASGCSEIEPDEIAEALDTSECAVGTDCGSERTGEPVDSPAEESVEVPHDCAEGLQPDATWIKPTDGKGNVVEPEPASDRDRASDIDCTRDFSGSYGFTMTVKGDGESLSKEEYTSYQVSFIVNNEWPNNVYYDDTGFAVYVSWQHLAQDYAGQVFDSNFSPMKGTSIEIEWLDESTLQVIVELPGDQIEVIEMRTELDVYISDADDNHVYDHRDVAIWTAQP